MFAWLRRKIQFAKMKRFYGQWIRPGDLCFDVGANIGDRTEVFLSLGARVVAVDPQPSCIAALRRRWANHPNVSLEPVALGRSPGRAKLKVCSEASTISTLSNEWTEAGRFSQNYKWDSEVEVELSTLDELVRKHGVPRLIKIDVEGFEHEVLSGLHTQVSCISIEYAREMKSVTLASIREIERALGDRAEFAFSYGESMKWDTPWLPSTELWKGLEARPDPADWGDIYARVTPST